MKVLEKYSNSIRIGVIILIAIADYDVKYDFAILESYELLIIRREGRLKGECLSSYPFRKQVGGTGRGYLKDLYDILKELHQKDKIGSEYYLREEDYYDLKQRKIYSGTLSNLGKSAEELVLDFIDIYHKFSIAESYERMYGAEFLEMQRLVKFEIEKRIIIRLLSKNSKRFVPLSHAIRGIRKNE